LILTLVSFYSLQGNGSTNGCCSKCWREKQKSKEAAEAAAAPKPSAVPVEEEPQPMDVEPEVAEPVEVKAPSPAANPLKKKKKKTSYKNMMAGIRQCTERDLEKEKEALRKVTGGGAFSKIDKI